MDDVAAEITVTVEAACEEVASRAELARVARFALAAEGHRSPARVEIVVVSDATIRDLNRQFLAHDEPTDVVTFALDGGAGFVEAGPPTLGEVYISCERAADQCADWGHTVRQELAFLVVHGVLHLLGWNDATDEERSGMQARQAIILDEYTALAHG